MSLREYLKDKLLFISINLMLFILLLMFLIYIEISFIWWIGIFIIWFLPMIIYFTLDYIKKKDFYYTLINSLESLDREYLVAEVMDEPYFLEGKIVYDALKSIEKDIHKKINYHENKEINYREYIEAWIHEIKTPIASTKLIINNNKSEATKNIETEILKIEEYLEQVLYYARSNDTSKDYIVKKIILKELIKTVLKKNMKSFIYNDISLVLEDLDEVVYTDPKWVNFIINQIIINSLKYSKKEEARIKIYSVRTEKNVILTIEDNGVGIPTEDVRRVFDKGFTGENGRKYGKSTGMGLYICKNLADKLGFGLELSSEFGVGTKVNIIFPIGDLTNI
ncbi:sensor histidine kinase [Clostridium mediterraneense]|uniref:sensor histidine kinase n=1 Tax=Clostridium mediterraneense TaxID=1805472 RepID=UPI000837A330|nr:ATP-binding protein [Clostridium mediterraneense]